MRTFKIVLIALAVLLAVFTGAGLVIGDRYRVERSVVIDADPGAIHLILGDLRRWDEWTPWAEEDTTVVSVVGERASGVGASQSWTANSGDGHLVFTATSPVRGVEFDVFFGKDPAAHRSALHYDSAGPATRVTWSMEGEMNMPVVGPWFALLSDRMMGPMFERGLENLRRAVADGRRSGDIQ